MGHSNRARPRLPCTVRQNPLVEEIKNSILGSICYGGLRPHMRSGCSHVYGGCYHQSGDQAHTFIFQVMSISRECENCRKVKRCQMYTPVATVIIYLCRPCARKFRFHAARAEALFVKLSKEKSEYRASLRVAPPFMLKACGVLYSAFF